MKMVILRVKDMENQLLVLSERTVLEAREIGWIVITKALLSVLPYHHHQDTPAAGLLLGQFTTICGNLISNVYYIR